MAKEYFGRRVAIGTVAVGLVGGLIYALSHHGPVHGAFLGVWAEGGAAIAAFAVIPVMLLCFAWNAFGPHGSKRAESVSSREAGRNPSPDATSIAVGRSAAARR